VPIRNESGLTRIVQDLTKCRQKISDMEAGRVGVIPAAAMHQSAGQAFERQLNARRSDVARLESEYLNAMLAERLWSPAAIIEAMGAVQYTVAPVVPVKDGVDTPGFGGRPV
jgi:hypothetical protein